MITGLENRQAVQLTDGSYIICIGNGGFEINGNFINLDYKPRQFRVGSLDDVKACQLSQREVDYYEDSNGNHIPPEVGSCAQQLVVASDGTELSALFLENKARFASYKPVYKPAEMKKIPIEFTVIGVASDTGSEFIECAIDCGLSSFPHYRNGVYKVLTGLIAKDELSKFNDVISIDNYGVYYAKLKDGTSIFSNGDTTKHKRALDSTSDTRIVSTIEEAKEIEKDIRHFISSTINIRLNKNSIKNDLVQYSNLYRELTEIMLYVKQIDPKLKTYSYHRSAVGRMEKLITALKES